jgi:hypothetical protein
MKRVSLAAAVVASGAIVMACGGAKRPMQASPAVPGATLWERPTDLAARDTYFGSWGREYAPNPVDTYTLVERKHSGVNLGMTVVDSTGREWSVKQPYPGGMDDESLVEVAVSRLLSAVGYHQPPVYYLPRWTLKDGPGQSSKQPEGRFRPRHSVLKDTGSWSWQENPFVGTQAYDGLRVLMMLLNQSDLKNSNNTLYEVKKSDGVDTTAARWYVARDIGAGLGETGRIDPKRNDVALFEQIAFMKGVEAGDVRFNYHGRHQELADHISPADVRWMCDLLSRFSDAQWQDAFRAAGYDTALANRFIVRIKAKIAEGRALGD